MLCIIYTHKPINPISKTEISHRMETGFGIKYRPAFYVLTRYNLYRAYNLYKHVNTIIEIE